ncbi:hypothetical protein HG530_012830 [Fusarium avenaceum]|nr:hypothetical protein HG530_012830 [Fusarium avenaceum]
MIFVGGRSTGSGANTEFGQAVTGLVNDTSAPTALTFGQAQLSSLIIGCCIDSSGTSSCGKNALCLLALPTARLFGYTECLCGTSKQGSHGGLLNLVGGAATACMGTRTVARGTASPAASSIVSATGKTLDRSTKTGSCNGAFKEILMTLLLPGAVFLIGVVIAIIAITATLKNHVGLLVLLGLLLVVELSALVGSQSADSGESSS